MQILAHFRSQYSELLFNIAVSHARKALIQAISEVTASETSGAPGTLYTFSGHRLASLFQAQQLEEFQFLGLRLASSQGLPWSEEHKIIWELKWL